MVASPFFPVHPTPNGVCAVPGSQSDPQHDDGNTHGPRCPMRFMHSAVGQSGTLFHTVPNQIACCAYLFRRESTLRKVGPALSVIEEQEELLRLDRTCQSVPGYI